jgi:hypothetical protein
MDEKIAKDIKNRHRERLMQIPGVHGVGLESDDGAPILAVYVTANPRLPSPSFPPEIEGLPVRVHHTEPFSKQSG